MVAALALGVAPAPAAAAPEPERAWTAAYLRDALGDPVAEAAQEGCPTHPIVVPEPGYEYERSCYAGDLEDQPARSTGVLVFWDDADGDGVEEQGEHGNCTATVAESDNRSVLVTAGHCVVEAAPGTADGRARWHRAFGFVPASEVRAFYRALASGGAELEAFVREELWPGFVPPGATRAASWSTSGWSERGQAAYDFAALVVAPRRDDGGSPEPIEDVLGGQRLEAADDAAGEEVRLLGFPGGAPFDGRSLIECRGVARELRLGSDPSPQLAVGCDMTGGASGGAWLLDVDGSGTGTIVSVISNGVPNVIAGPMLGGPHLEAFERAQRLDVDG